MERCIIVDYGFLQSQPSHSLQGNSKRVHPSRSHIGICEKSYRALVAVTPAKEPG